MGFRGPAGQREQAKAMQGLLQTCHCCGQLGLSLTGTLRGAGDQSHHCPHEKRLLMGRYFFAPPFAVCERERPPQTRGWKWGIHRGGEELEPPRQLRTGPELMPTCGSLLKSPARFREVLESQQPPVETFSLRGQGIEEN